MMIVGHRPAIMMMMIMIIPMLCASGPAVMITADERSAGYSNRRIMRPVLDTWVNPNPSYQ